jgi:hypothetical protein
MKNMIQKATIVLGVALIAFTSCRKDTVQNVISGDDETVLAAQAVNDMNAVGVITDESTSNIMMDDQGIAADFQVEATDCDLISGANGGGADDSIRARVRARSFVKCLNGLNLSGGQKDSIKHLLRGYVDCKADAIARARSIYHDLQLVYKAKAEKLFQAFRDGKITKEQLEKSLKELRDNFRNDLRAKQIAEKLDDAMKACFTKFLRGLHSILNETQWKAFVACHKH